MHKLAVIQQFLAFIQITAFFLCLLF